MSKSTMTKREYYGQIEAALLAAMSEIDHAVRLMNIIYHENHKEASTALKSKEMLKKLLNEKFDSCAANRRLQEKV